MRSPRARHPSSPALAALRTALVEAPTGAAASTVGRLVAAGGVVAEAARAPDLRRALPSFARWLEAAELLPRVPPAERATLAAARLSAAAAARRVAATLEPLGAALATVGVAPLLLKGTALHGTAVDPALRPVSDADLYLRAADLDAFRRAAGAAGLAPDALTAARLADYDASGGRAHRLSDLVFRRTDGAGVPVEGKLDPVQVGVPLRTAAAFLEGATPSPVYRGFLVPAAEPMAVQQALHLARHDGSDLLWWAELARGVRDARAAGRFDRDRMEALVAGEGLLGTVREALREAAALFPGCIEPALVHGAAPGGVTLARFRTRHAAPSEPDERAATWALQLAHVVGSGRWLAAAAALARRLRPGDAYVRARFGLPADAPVDGRLRARRLLATLLGRTP